MDEFDEVFKLRHLYKALGKCCAGSMWKDGTALYRSNGLANCVLLRRDLLGGSYKLQRYLRFSITRPKTRIITATRIRDRHGQRSACDRALYPALTRSFIHNNGACQHGKGVDFTLNNMKRELRSMYCAQRREIAARLGCPVEKVGPFTIEGSVYKGDVKGYFPNTKHKEIKAIIRGALKSERLTAYFCAVVESFGDKYWETLATQLGADESAAKYAARLITDARTEREYLPIRPANKRAAIAQKCATQIRRAVAGLPGLTDEGRRQMHDEAEGDEARGVGLGSQMSQLVQLAQLSPADHYAKEVCRVRIYNRYMDDYIIIDRDKEKVVQTAKGYEVLLNDRGLTVNPKSQLIELKHGFIFLRWHLYITPRGKVVMRAAPGVAANEKRRLRRMAAKVRQGLATVDSLKRHYQGWRAHIERGDTDDLLKSMDDYFNRLLAGIDEKGGLSQ